MPRIIEYTENEGTAQTSANTLMQLINSSKTSTAGLAGFHIKTVVVSAVSGTVFGEAASMLLSGIFGPGISFLGGATFGFLGSIVHRWRTDTREAREAFEEYPELMEHHLRHANPEELKYMTFKEWKRDISTNIRKQGFAVAALYSASPAIQRIREMKEEELISAAVERLNNSPSQTEDDIQYVSAGSQEADSDWPLLPSHRHLLTEVCPFACTKNTTCCDGKCLSLKTDVTSCGKCGRKCRSGEVCLNGKCRCSRNARCRPGKTCCSGSCADLKRSEKHCGACGLSCARGEECFNKVCTCGGGPRCTEGLSCCYGSCKSFDTDSKNCGSCGNICSSSTECVVGKCMPKSITKPQEDQPAQLPQPGCGAPGVVCNADQICMNGACVCADAKAVVCDGKCVDASNYQSDVSNCGSCGHRCSPGGSCISGTCFAPTYKGCSSNEECGEGRYCFETSCVSCLQDSHCDQQSDLKICSDTKKCIECTLDSHCGACEVCKGSKCIPDDPNVCCPKRSGCISYNKDCECIKCNDNLILIASRICVPKVPHCIEYTPGTARCSDCEANYDLYEDKKCCPHIESCNAYDAECRCTDVELHNCGVVTASAVTSCAIAANGELKCWGNNLYGQTVPQSGNWSMIECGHAVCCGILSDGVLKCFGNTPNINLSDVPSSASRTWKSFSVGYSIACALDTEGVITCFGSDGLNGISGLQQYAHLQGKFTSVNAEGGSACGIAEGMIYCWGSLANSVQFPSPSIGHYTMLTIGHPHSCALTNYGQVICINYYSDVVDYGPPLDPGEVWVSVAAGPGLGFGFTLGLKNTGELLCWGDNTLGVCNVYNTPPQTYSAIAAGSGHSCALTADGTVHCWGYEVDGVTIPPQDVTFATCEP